MEFIPVKVDTDYLIIGNIPALKAMSVGIVNAEKQPDSVQKGAIIKSAYTEALAELDSELLHYKGEGTTIGINLQGSSIYSNNEIPVLM